MSLANEHFRLTILRLLSGARGYTANSSLIHSAVAEFGFTYTRDQVKTELAWLAEQGLVAAHEVKAPEASPLVVARLTERGLEAAQGLATVPGVARPAPGA